MPFSSARFRSYFSSKTVNGYHLRKLLGQAIRFKRFSEEQWADLDTDMFEFRRTALQWAQLEQLMLLVSEDKYDSLLGAATGIIKLIGLQRSTEVCIVPVHQSGVPWLQEAESAAWGLIVRCRERLVGACAISGTEKDDLVDLLGSPSNILGQNIVAKIEPSGALAFSQKA